MVVVLGKPMSFIARIPTDATNTHLVKDAMVLIFLARKFPLPFWQSKECMGVRLLENSVHREQQTVVLFATVNQKYIRK